MLVNIKLRLTSPILGELKKDNRGIRRFKTSNGQIHINVAVWGENFKLAARQLGLNVNTDTIVTKSSYRPASIHLFSRIYSRVHSEMFESFRKGTILTLEFLIRNDIVNSPTPDELKAIFNFIGEYVGISQFGNKFGFGRFTVHALDPVS